MRNPMLFVLSCAVILSVLSTGQSIRADDDFQYHAYIRSGVLESGQGGKGVPFQAPGAAAKFRLGNEAETYGEAILQKNFNQDGTGPNANVQTLIAYKTYQNNQWSADTDEFTVREAFAEFGNFEFAPAMSFWAGSRFYRRLDIHIDDFYWLDTSGYGGGMQDIPLGDTLKLQAAYLRGSPDNAVDLNNVGVINKQILDLRITDIPVGFGTLELVALPSYVKGGKHETTMTNGDEEEVITTEVDDETAIGLCAVHSLNFANGFNKAAVQWGNGVAMDFGSSLWATPTKVTSDAWRLRFLDYGVWQPNDSFAMMFVGIAQTTDNGEDDNSRQDWYSLGARPTYYFNKNFSLAVEMGVDHTKQEGAAVDGKDLEGTLGKITLCPQIALDNTFFARPVLRAFVTLATWSDDFKGQVGGTPYADDTAGLNYGVQMEAWF
ncbi:MAG: carbohydrate porin [Spartobacteria bacterium]|nr:carbohydrate porin [Spartobacteria bacterium]